LPVLTVGGSFVRRTRSINNRGAATSPARSRRRRSVPGWHHDRL